ncbi:tetratricopeptide repeat protein [Aureliella helgolandensis]|uniref:tetratricopeptide repeat protein n=1 Tax=Aureliella helgolandensis TaxID=2527968 RepID=UPI0018D18A73|nr:tetratricopeptide repeat protein [Aureliella helgolandensis]
MVLRSSAFVLLAVSALESPAIAQRAEIRLQATAPATSSISASNHSAASGNSAATAISPNLRALYQRTQAVRSEADVTAIARACANVVSSQKSSTADRDYAGSLLAWALNRRGEMRNEAAAAMVQRGALEEADKLDHQAADDFETAIQYGPTNWRIHHNFAISLAMKGDYARAINSVTRALELKPDYANAYFNRGELYFELGRFEQASKDYSLAIERDATDPQYYNSRAHSQFMLEDYDVAIADYQRAAELGTDSAVYQSDLADAYQFLGKWEEAAQAYRSAVAINNKYARAYQNASWLMATCPDRKFRNGDLALSAAKKALELGDANSPRVLETLAAANAANGKFTEAIQFQRRALAVSSDAERSEVQQRLSLYEAKTAYVQPRLDSSTTTGEPGGANRVRTASNKTTQTRQ